MEKYKEMKKFLFLDIDGVLNHEDWYKYRATHRLNLEYPLSEFDPYCVNRVKRILKETGAKLVISSSWRIDKNLNKDFEKVGLPTNFDITCPHYNNSKWRGDEIQEYLDKVEEEYKYCILDDDIFDFRTEQKKYLLRTAADYNDESLVDLNGGTGLTEIVTNRAIKLLNN